MTSFRQWQANRRNAVKSTGPVTEEGKHRSRGNAVRHGLCAETVIGALEDAADYKAFEAAIVADYDAQSAVERELVLRLASALWRLRRATAMETGLFALEADHVAGKATVPWLPLQTREGIAALFRADRHEDDDATMAGRRLPLAKTSLLAEEERADPHRHLAQYFLRLASLPTCPLDRLSRYEYTLWRQVAQILFALDNLNRRKPQERKSFRLDYRQKESSPYAPDDD
jgi:hypothetical protein